MALFCSSIEFIAGIYNSISCYNCNFRDVLSVAIPLAIHRGLSWMFLLVPVPEFLSAILSLLPIPGINLQHGDMKTGRKGARKTMHNA